MTIETSRLRLPYLSGAQAQKHVTLNEALAALDALVAAAVLDKDLAAPPGSPADGDAYIVPAAATGAWSGWDGSLAQALDGGWRRHLPVEGLQCWVADEAKTYVYQAGAWAGVSPVPLAWLDADGALAANSDSRVPTQKAAKTYADTKIAGAGTVTAGNPAVFSGTTGAAVAQVTFAAFKTSLALAKADVGLGSVDNLQQLPLSYLDTDGALAANSDAKVASQKAAKTYADGKIGGSLGSTDNRLLRADGTGGKTAQDSAVTVDDSGNVSGVGTLASSGLLTLGGGQIAFPAGQNASSDANTLDDYEEGTFTPTFTAQGTAPSGVTYTTQLGAYLKVGRLVHVQINVTLSSKGTGGTSNMVLTGLPFTVNDYGAATAAMSFQVSNLTFGGAPGTQVVGVPVRGNTTILMGAAVSNGANQNVTWAQAANTSAFIGGGTYIANA